MRLEITRKADLAVRALQVLAESDERMKAGELAEALQSTPGFVPHVLGPLVKQGWVRSEPGPTGGYSLSASLATVSVLEVVEVVDGPTDAFACVVDDRHCAVAPVCAMHVAWNRAHTELTSALGATAIADLRGKGLGR